MTVEASRERFDAALKELHEAAVELFDDMGDAVWSQCANLADVAGAQVHAAYDEVMITDAHGELVSRGAMQAERDARDREIDYLRSR